MKTDPRFALSDHAHARARRELFFGVTESIAAFLATDIGLGATAGAIGADALLGAGGGAVLGAATGGDPGLGALGGAIGGAGFGAGGAFAGDLGVSTGIGEALGGAAGGALSSAFTGSNPFISAGLGALPGLANSAFSGAGAAGGAGTTGGGASAASAAPVSGASGAPVDLTGGGSVTSDFSGLGTANLTVPDPTLAGMPGGGTTNFSLVTDPTGNGAGVSGVGQLDQTLAAAGGGNAGGGFGIPAVDPTNAAGSVAGNAASMNDLAATYGVGGSGGAGGTSTFDKFLADPSLKTGWKALESNAGPVLSGGLLLKNLFAGNTIPGLDNLKGLANTLNTQGTANQGYIQNGTLPPGAQSQLQLADKGAEARVRSFYSGLGMSGSSAEATDLANLKLASDAQRFTMAKDLLDTGVRQTGISADILAQIIGINQKQDAETGSAIANFVASLGGGRQNQTYG